MESVKRFEGLDPAEGAKRPAADEAAVSRYLAAIEAGTLADLDTLGDDATLDATVPNWRFSVHGVEAVRAELGRWYADPGSFEDLTRTPVPAGELVTFTLRWEEHGVPHAAHQAHVISVHDGRIQRDQVWCGGRWPAALLAEMAEAGRG
jgi:hypothetical protein